MSWTQTEASTSEIVAAMSEATLDDSSRSTIIGLIWSRDMRTRERTWVEGKKSEALLRTREVKQGYRYRTVKVLPSSST